MFGIGPTELLVTVPLFLLIVGLPIAVVVWIVWELLKQSRKLDEILMRLGALEESRARRDQ